MKSRPLAIAVVVMLLAALGMAFYAWHFRARVNPPLSTAYSAPVAPPASGPTENVTLYVAHDDPGTLEPQVASIAMPSGRQQRAEELLRALVEIYLGNASPHPLGPGSEVRAVYLVDPGLVVIDLNAAFADGHRSGVLVEELTIASLIQTLTANVQGITRAKILVDGKERETLAGHADIGDFYDIATVDQLVAQLQTR